MIAAMIINLTCTSLASAGQMTYDAADDGLRETSSYNPSNPSHKLDEATNEATLWESVPVDQMRGKWIASLKIRTELCWLYDTEVLCNDGSKGACQWKNDKCDYTKPLTDEEEFCFSTPKGEELNQQQCDWLPYWKEEARKPSSKSIGKCELVDGRIQCAEEDTCEAGELRGFTKPFQYEIKTFECKKDCDAIPDEGIKQELTQRCCAKCLSFKNTQPEFIHCLGCEEYSDIASITESLVECEWSKDDRMKEICKHEGRCKTGEATTSKKSISVQCGVVPCDPACLHDRQMYASCCEVCLEKMCGKNQTTGKFTKYGKHAARQDNQMCRGCVRPTTTTTTTTTTTPNTTCTPFCCGKVFARKFDDQSDELDNPSTWLMISIVLFASFGVLSGAAVCLCCSRRSERGSYRRLADKDNVFVKVDKSHGGVIDESEFDQAVSARVLVPNLP
jgi:hypothetical protein